MADIVLAEHRGHIWLVSGERYIDDLLANTLPGDISIEIVACELHADVNDLWSRSGDQSDSPWMINPAIVRRIKQATAGNSVLFGQLSIMLDDEARSAIAAAVNKALLHSGSDVVLASFVEPGSPRMMIDLANLRCSVIETELVAQGVALTRISRSTRDFSAEHGANARDLIDIVIDATA